MIEFLRLLCLVIGRLLKLSDQFKHLMDKVLESWVLDQFLTLKRIQ